jgi:hypothetical protein
MDVVAAESVGRVTPTAMSPAGTLRCECPLGTVVSWTTSRDLSRRVMEIFGALADISSDTRQILAILRDEDEEEDDGEEEPLDA